MRNYIVTTSTLLLTILCLSWPKYTFSQIAIPLNDPNIYYDGVLYPVVSAGSVIFNRHTPAAYSDPSSGIVYFPCNTTRNTQTGIRIRFTTASPYIYMSFLQRSSDGYFAIGSPTNGFNVYANGSALSSFSTTSFTINNPQPGTAVLFEITLPNLWSVDLNGLQLDNGYTLVASGANTKKKYAAFGTSITHGTGQYVSTAQTYAFQLAQNKGWNLHNFAVAGSTVGWQLAYDIKGQSFDYITVEQGFNDWASSFPQSLSVVSATYAKFIDSLRKFQPTAKIYCIAPIVTTYVPSAPLYTMSAFRTEVANIVSTRQLAGDNKIFFIDGSAISDASMLADGVHMNVSGAAQFASSLINIIEPAPVVVNPGFVSASNSNFQYTGRIDFANPSRPQFSFPGVSIKANFEGTSVGVVIKDFAGGGAQNTNYFNVIIDGGTPIVLGVNGTDTLYPITSSLSNSNHSIEIFKRTESVVGKSEFRGLVLDVGKSLIAPPIRPLLKFEFIGDSYTCGYGNMVNIPAPPAGNPNTGFNSVNENNYMAWGALASRTLNAEYVCTSYSGRGVYRNNTGQTTNTVPLFYDRIIPDVPTSVWNKNNYIPDVVVIHLGTNDFYPISVGNPLDSASFVNSYKSFVTKLRGYYPAACIVLATPNGLSDWYPSGAYNATRSRNYVRAVRDYFSGIGDNKVYYFQMTQQGMQGEPYGEDWHPSIQTHQIMSNELVSFVNSTVTCTTPLPLSLASFSATNNLNDVELNWSTIAELNHNYFDIERSADGVNFSSIGIVNGHQGSTQLQQYVYTDTAPLSGISYYRLRFVDTNATSNFSNTLYLNRSAVTSVLISPNPNSGNFKLSMFGGSGENYEYNVYNSTGISVVSGSIKGNQAVIDMSREVKGIYFVRINSGEKATVHTILLE